MLYDPKWEVKTLFSRENLIAWLEKQNPDETYAWHCQGECMLGLWLRSIDRYSCEDPDGHTFSYIVHGEPVNCEQFSSIAMYGEPTFGAALERARGDF